MVPRGNGPFQAQVVVDGIDHHFSYGGASSDGLGVFQFALHFDPAVVSITRMEKGDFMGSTGRSISCLSRLNAEDHSVFDFACVSQGPPDAGPQGSGTLAILTLTPVNVGTSSLSLAGEMGGPLGDTGDDIPVTFTDASVRVEGTPLSTQEVAQTQEASATLGAGNGGTQVSPNTPIAGTPQTPESTGGATVTVRTATPKPPAPVDGQSQDGGGSSNLRLILISILGGLGIVVVLGSVLYRRGVMAFLAQTFQRSRARGQ